MDEPTNDLDVETLELLEEMLGEYAGTLILVSHDREFLDNVVTSTLVLEGEGRVGEYVGGYSDWLRQRSVPVAVRDREETPQPQPQAMQATPAKRRLSYKDARELEQLPARIESLEARMAELTRAMNDASFFRQGADEIVAANRTMASTQADLDAAYARWQELESEG